MYISEIFITLITAVTFRKSLQLCPEEVSSSGIEVTWKQSSQASFIKSEPQCLQNETLITRNCSNNEWRPPLNEVPACYTALTDFNSPCPPGFKKISTKYCYKIVHPSSWNYPCFRSGSATVITEFDSNEIDSLIDTLNNTSHSYFWLPALRHRIFAPIVWSVPGPNWGRSVKTDILPLKASLLRKCLVLDVKHKQLLTDSCNKEYPSLCFFTNNIHYPAKCPKNYHAFGFMLDEGKCFGIEKAETTLTYQEFLDTKCKMPMGDTQLPLRRFIFSILTNLIYLQNDTWCWFSKNSQNESYYANDADMYNISSMVNVIDRNGAISLKNPSSHLTCMACEVNMTYIDTEIVLEYDEEKNQLYLVVYSPLGLWIYNDSDRGVQCFSDADGFFKVVEINNSSTYSESEERVSYVIDLVTDRSASYWCEGHSKKFTLLRSKQIVVNPGGQVHVFAVVVKLSVDLNETDRTEFSIRNFTDKITAIFQAEKVLLMDVLEHTSGSMHILIHLHVAVNDTYSKESQNLQETLDLLHIRAKTEFPKYNYSLINISSSIYCLPTTSPDYITLQWDLTSIGYIAAPRQFCLQSNGLPVNRQCHGSYLLGSVWGDVEGVCDLSYKPSNTTTFLFNFTKTYAKTNYVYTFLTVYLEHILNDISILIPADIYYLSLSFKIILRTAKQNLSSIETGDIRNIAWIMDRMMNVNNSNLRLAQKMNSTNAILESTSNIIEIITAYKINETNQDFYQLAVKPGFIIQVSYPKFNNITGIAVMRNGSSHKFTNMIIEPLYKNTTIQNVLSIKNLEVAAWLPHDVVENLQLTSNQCKLESTDYDTMHIIINVYNDNSIFQELIKRKHLLNSRIVEVSIPGYNTNLEYPIPLIFRQLNDTGSSNACGYWDFQSEIGSMPGSWSKLGCALKMTLDGLAVCECYHLTHFAQLLHLNREPSINNPTDALRHEKALNIITLVGGLLSLSGIVGIWITAMVFDSWRKKIGPKVLLHLSLSIALPLTLVIVFSFDNTIVVESQGRHIVPINKTAICVVLGALFHYSVLSNFMWMLITAILQFIRYVRVLGVSRPSRFMIKIAFIGWGIPLVPVVIILLIDYKNYIPSPSTSPTFCYPNGLYMIFGVIVPVCVVLIINIVLFLLVIESISKSTDVRATYRNLVCAQFRLSIFLFFLLGLTWIFGVASFSGQFIWSYLFCLTSTIQGFVLFVYFIICDPTTRNMWITVMKPQFKRSRSSITTISSS